MADRWIDDEPRLGRALAFVIARARRRAWLVMAVTVALTLAIVGMRVRRKPSYIATAVVRITEGFESTATPSPPASLRNHLANLALTHSLLAGLMTRYHIGDPSSSSAIDLFKDRIEIGVKQNYFLNVEEGPKSALITIEFSAGTPTVASGVVHDLAAAISATQEAQRSARLDAARELYASALQLLREQLRQLDLESSRLGAQLTGDGAADTLPEVRLGHLRDLKNTIHLRLINLEQRAAEIDFASSAERYGAGMTFELVDEEVDAFGQPLDKRGVAQLALTWFVVFLPIIAIIVGAFNRRVYSRDDIAHLGVPLFGVLPRFAGDGIGSLAERTRRKQV